MSSSKILVVDDDKFILHAFDKLITKEGHQILTASNGRTGLETITREKPDLIFLDVAMPEMTGLEVLEKYREQGGNAPVIVLTGYGTIQTAIEAIRLGAYEYCTKPLDSDRIRVLIRRALETKQLREEVQTLRTIFDSGARDYELVGHHASMQKVYKAIGTVCTTPNNINVLVTGETGTGKELVARAIHNNGPHPDAPFIGVNCAVLPETLLESELFGHERGAFTHAIEKKIGKFEAAMNGTIFLDEIGDLSPTLQQKLLRVLQERTFERLGSNAPIQLSARFITATHRDLEKAVKEQIFRVDLYYRLNVVQIQLPPLRDRGDDISLLAQYFVAKYNHCLGRTICSIDGELLMQLQHYEFPGNVRELENIIERGITFSKGDKLRLEDIGTSLGDVSMDKTLSIPLLSPILKEARETLLACFEREFVIARLKGNNGNVTYAAKEAQIERQSFQKLMRKYNIHSEDFRH